jgi:hypothetical protein
VTRHTSKALIITNYQGWKKVKYRGLWNREGKALGVNFYFGGNVTGLRGELGCL